MDLFESGTAELKKKNAPLADRMRPQTLEQFVGQDHIIGKGRLLRRAIEIDRVSSIILYGPPGSGKTTLARIIANTTKAEFISINAVLAGVKDIRESIEKAQTTLQYYSRKTILFVDEVHRFNKSQQDALLPHVENGTITLIGATTENPYFEVNKALVSRSRIFQLRTLEYLDLVQIVKSVLNDEKRGYGHREITIDPDALEHLCRTANGDARSVLNALELAIETTKAQNDGVIRLTESIIEESIQRKAVLYDKDGDAHYDVISAFIKSLRGSDPDASLYWLARMIYAGEDPRFIFRRMVIFASEDVGLADPNALTVVMAASQAYDFVGMPEGRFPLSQACLYLATAPKSNTTLSLFDALKSVEQEENGDVPDHLKDGSRDRQGFGHGEGYLYPHAFRDHWVAQQYLPNTLQGKMFYNPSDQGYELSIKERVTRQREVQIATLADSADSGTFLWAGGAFGGWEQRTDEKRGSYFDTLRSILFKSASIKSEHLVLDLNCQSGFLTSEAVRIANVGGVWAIAHTESDFELTNSLCSLSQDTFDSPEIVHRGNQPIDRLLCNRAGGDMAFDRIIGRNILVLPNIEHDLKLIPNILADGGEIHLAELLVSESTSLTEAITDPGMSKILANVEKTLHKNAHADKVCSLMESLQIITGLEVRVRKERILLTDSFTKKSVLHWFRKENDRSSLGDLIEEMYGADVVERIKHTLIDRLTKGNFPWYQTVAFISLKRSATK